MLTIAASNLLPPTATQALLVVALALLAESFGRDVWWLWRNRLATPDRVTAAVADRPTIPRSPPVGDHAPASLPLARAQACPCGTGLRVVLTILAALVVWVALVAPYEPRISR